MSHLIIRLLDEHIRAEYQIRQQGERLQLEETDLGSSCPAVLIKKRGALRAFNFEPGEQTFPYFQSSVPGLVKMCDSIIFYPNEAGNEKQLFVFLCELKSNNSKGSSKQVHAAWVFAQFLIHTLERLVGMELEVEYRAIICRPSSLRPPSRVAYSAYDNGLKYVYHNANTPIQMDYYTQ